MKQSPSVTVTFLFTDLEGSTRLWEGCSDAMPAALARHDEILGHAIVAHGGRVFSSSGDGQAAVFATAADAMAAALAAQLDLGAEEWRATGPLRVRMGIHSGAAEEQGGDYLGPTVNRAARLMAVAHGGQVVCSRASAELAGDRLPLGADLIDLGEHRLRDLARAERVLQLAHPSLPADFPPLSSLDAYPTNLPGQTSVFVGREPQLAEVATAVDESRIVTLTGVGGVGKTRLALQVAADLLPRYRDGAWLVELGPTVDPEAVPEVVANALDMTQRQGRSIIDSLLDFLAWKRALLVLDNCEHLLDAAAQLVERITRGCPHVALLATSREGLGVAGERMLAVPSLELPGEDGELKTVGESEAVRLFVQRAMEARADFALSADNATAVAGLCRRLDGIPLAIELAAARVRSLTPAELAARLADRFRLLAGGRRTAVERHQTLRRAIDWSYDLLPGTEQRVLNRLSVFAGGFSLAAAEAVIGGDRIEAAAVFDLLGHLVDKSLVLAEAEGAVTRYRLLETIRQYAENRLEERGEAEDLRRRHAEHYATFAAEARGGLRSADELAWTKRTEAELDNLRTALAWSVANGDVDLALRLATPLAVRGTRMGHATSSWTDPVVGMAGAADHPLFPVALAWAGWAAQLEGDLERAAALGHEALDAADAQGANERVLCRVLNTTAVVANYRGVAVEVRRDAERWVGLARALGDEFELAIALLLPVVPLNDLSAGVIAEAAIERADEALAVARRLGNPTALAYAAQVAGSMRRNLDPDRALELLDLAIEAGTSVRNEQAVGTAFTMKAGIHSERGDWRAACRAGVRSIEHFRRVGDHHDVGMSVAYIAEELTDAVVDEAAAVLHGAVDVPLPDYLAEREAEASSTLRDRLGNERFAELAARGAAMDEDGLIAFIADEVEPLLPEDDAELAQALAGPNEFHRDGDTWLLTYDRRSCRLRDSKGLHYLAALLVQPGQEVHVFDLVGSGVAGGGSGEALDAEAKAAYRRRLGELQAAEAEATEWGDSGRADRARLEIEAIAAELASAYGLGGRPRKGADPTERARKAVANRIRDALARIESAHVYLGRHLRNSVRTGSFCSYEPERPTVWRV